MDKSTIIPVYVLVDADGNYAAGDSPEGAREAYEQNWTLGESDGFRIYELTLTVPVPHIVPLKAAITDDGGEVTITVKESQ